MSIIDELTSALGPAKIALDATTLGVYAVDQAPVLDYQLPQAVVHAESIEDVQATVRACAAHGVPLVARGAGTGVSGGAHASKGCVVLSLERMNRILDLNPDDETAVVEPGVVNADLNAAAARPRTDVRAGPGQLQALHHRRQRRHQRRRPALRQVRGDPRLGAGARRRAGGRLAHPHRPPDLQGRRRLRPHRAVRRLRRDAGDRRRHHRPAQVPAAGRAHDRRLLPGLPQRRGGCPRRRQGPRAAGHHGTPRQRHAGPAR